MLLHTMHWVALLQPPPDPEYTVRVLAEGLSLTMAEARMRLAPEPPMFLARMELEKAEHLAEQLRARDFHAVSVDEHAPQGQGWMQVREFAFEEREGVFHAANHEELRIPWENVIAVVRGSSRERTSQETTSTQKKIDLKKAAITGGLKFTSTETTTVRSQTTEMESKIYVFDDWGQCAVLKELSIKFLGLGPRMQPTRTGNMNALTQWLREKAHLAVYDDRLVRLGMRSLPHTPGSESYVHTKELSRRVESTASSVDLMAETLRLGVVAGYLK